MTLAMAMKALSDAKIDTSIYGEFKIGIYAHNLQFYFRSERALCPPVFFDLFVYIGINFEFPQVFLPQKLNLDIIRKRIERAFNSFTICTQTHTDKHLTLHICLSQILPLAKNQLKQMRAK